MDENRGDVGDPWVGRSSGAVGFALTSILSQGERKLPLYHACGFRYRIGVRGRLFAGMTNSGGTELWLGTVNQHGGFCHAPPRPQRGTSPSPREVFDRATFPSPTPPLDSSPVSGYGAGSSLE